MKRSLSGLCLAAVACWLVAAFAASPARAWEPFRKKNGDVESGNDLLKKGDASGALSAYDRAQKALPTDPGVEVNRGLALSASGELDAAREAFAKVARGKAPKELRAIAGYNLGQAFLKQAEEAQKADDLDKAQGFLREAVDALKGSLRDGPGNRDAAWNLELARRQLVEVEKKQQEKKKQEQEQKDQQDQQTQDQQDPQGQDPQNQDPQGQDPQSQDSKGQDPQSQDSKGQDPQNQDSKGQDPQSQDSKGQDPQNQDSKGQDPQSQDSKGQDPQNQDPKGQDPQNQDPKGQDQQDQNESPQGQSSEAPKQPEPPREQKTNGQSEASPPEQATKQPPRALPQHMQQALDALSNGEESLEKYRANMRARQRPRRIEKDW